MKAYIFQAALWCAACAQAHKAAHAKPAHVDEANESSYDSDEWPKGPYGDGGGEADCPQHCDGCRVFLGNPLTQEGSNYVKRAWREHVEEARGGLEVLKAWRDGYPNEWAEWCAAMEAEFGRFEALADG